MFFDKDYNFDMGYFNLENKDKFNYDITEKNYNTENNYETIIMDSNDLDNYMIGSYNNFLEKRDNKIDLKNGFYLGNLFTDTYKPYKNKKAKKINAYSDRQKMLLRIFELDFILNDLNLYLDVNPKDNRVFDLLKKNAIELNKLKDEYNKKYQVLELCKDTNDKYTWLDNPWSWDGDANV